MDLSRLPEPLQGKLRAQLDRLPAEYRAPLEAKLAKLPADKLEEVLAKTVPMLERLAQKKSSSSAGKPSNSSVKSSSASVTGPRAGQEPTYERSYDPHDHYNTTIQRGDRQGPPLIVIFVIAGLLLLMLQALGLLGWD